MLFPLIGMLLFSWAQVESKRTLEMQPKLTPILASLGEMVNISCSFPDNFYTDQVTWYKEKQDRSLHKIAENYTSFRRQKQLNLIFYNVQKNHSGVYYCAAADSGRRFTILSGSRVTVSDVSRPSSSLLIPPLPTLEGDPFNHSIPVLCLFLNANPSQALISWDINGEATQDCEALEMIDEKGEFSLWSWQLFPPERWNEGVSFTCSDQENRTVTALISKSTVAAHSGNCFYALYAGLPFVVLLLLLLFLILLFRDRLARGKGEKPPPQVVHMREIPQTEYAEVHQIK